MKKHFRQFQESLCDPRLFAPRFLPVFNVVKREENAILLSADGALVCKSLKFFFLLQIAFLGFGGDGK